MEEATTEFTQNKAAATKLCDSIKLCSLRTDAAYSELAKLIPVEAAMLLEERAHGGPVFLLMLHVHVHVAPCGEILPASIESNTVPQGRRLASRPSHTSPCTTHSLTHTHTQRRAGRGAHHSHLDDVAALCRPRMCHCGTISSAPPDRNKMGDRIRATNSSLHAVGREIHWVSRLVFAGVSATVLGAHVPPSSLHLERHPASS